MYDPLFCVDAMDAAVDYLHTLNDLMFSVSFEDMLNYEEQTISLFLNQQGLWK